MLYFDKARKQNIGFWLAFFMIWIFLFWKCRYGFSNMDESFYLTIPYRFCQGDKLFLHEWHMSQTSGLLLVPLMRTYLSLFHNTEGICLHFRWLFTFFWGSAALFFYYRLRMFSAVGSMLSSLAYLIYAPFGIMALSYNTLGILLLLSTCIIIATSRNHSLFEFFCSGILLAMSVLCCPHLLILYLAFCLLTLLKRDSSISRCWAFMTLGACFVFLLFCILLISQASVADYLSVIPALFSDPEHPTLHLPTKVLILITTTWDMNHATIPITFIVIILSFICLRKNLRYPGFIITSFLVAYLLCSYWYINHYMFPLSLLGFYCYVTGREDDAIRKLFHIIWIPGCLYAFCIHLSSNQNFQAFTSASTVSTIASIVIICRYVKNLIFSYSLKKAAKTILVAVWVLLLGLQFYQELSSRYHTVYWESGMQNQTVLAEEGPQKGILMNAPIHEFYSVSEQDIQQLCSDSSIQSILILSLNDWLYLSAEKQFSTYSAWLSSVNDTTLGRLDTYFALFPGKMPDAILIDRDYKEYVSHYEMLGYERINASQISEYAIILKRSF